MIEEVHSDNLSSISSESIIKNTVPRNNQVSNTFRFLSPFYTKDNGLPMSLSKVSTMDTNKYISREEPHNFITTNFEAPDEFLSPSKNYQIVNIGTTRRNI